MDVTSSFVSRSVTSTINLNWVFLVDWLIVLFASIMFIFYFNRIIGNLVTWFVTNILWRRHHKKISIQSIKINLLAGRIFLKNVMIVTPNELILIHTAVFTWKYWLQFVRKSQFFIQGKKLNEEANKKLPSRFCLDIVGLEMFVYNKSSSYDNIEAILKNEMNIKTNMKNSKNTSDTTFQSNTSSLSSNTSSATQRHSSPSDSSNNTHIPIKFEGKNTEFSDVESNNSDDLQSVASTLVSETMDSRFLDFLPFEIKISKGSFLLGNETTPCLCVASYSSISGHIDAALPGSSLDHYRTHYDFTVSDLKIDMKPNVSFKNIETMERKIDRLSNQKKSKRFFRMVSGLKHSLVKLSNYFDSSQYNNTHNQQDEDFNSYDEYSYFNDNSHSETEWKGLERYLTTHSSSDSDSTADSMLNHKCDNHNYHDTNNHSKNNNNNNNTEYAKWSNIVDCSTCHINYYYDIPGLVPSKQKLSDFVDHIDIGNKDTPPMLGLDIVVYGATICYGPWAEKNRGFLHQLLFPSLYRDTVPFPKLESGMRRQYVSFDLSFECGDELIFRIPHREESKDYLYLKNDIHKLRHFGWFNLKMSKGSIIDFYISMIPTLERGTDNKLNAVFIKPEISTSVNHDVLFQADEHILNGSIPFPLEWNSLVNWKFENISKNAELYLLREHITLISDLLTDFGSGDPTPYELFRPFIYNFNWKFYEYAIYLNINEKNIINNPLDPSVNTYLTFTGSYMFVDIKVPMTTVYKKSNTVEYLLETTGFDLAVEHPASSTFSNFMKDEQIGSATDFKLEGSYTIYSFMEIDSCDTIIMNCSCSDTTVKVYGFAIKYFMSLKDNYFGDHTHFQNLLEFRDSFGKEMYGESEPFDEGKRLKNETDLMFSFQVNNGCLIFPCHLYDCTSHLALHFDNLDIDMRNNNYYMDLQANFSEISGRYIDSCDESIIFENTKKNVQFVPEISISDLSIHSIRIFGLPPSEPTYYCRWDFNTSNIKIEAEPIFLNALTRAGMSFGAGHEDLENSFSIPEIPVMDILNLSFKCPDLNIIIKRNNYTFKLGLNELFFKLTDQPTTFYNALLTLVIDKISIEGYNGDHMVLKLITSVGVKNFIQKKDAFERMKQQAMHLKKHDAPFHRTPFLIPEFAKDRKYFKGYKSIVSSIYYPDPPLPVTSQSVDMIIDSMPAHIQQRLENVASNFDDYNDEDYDDFFSFSSNLGDFEILKSLDPSCSYNTIPMKFGNFEIFVSPAIAPIIVDFISDMTDFSMHSILDQLQDDFLTFFKFQKENDVLKMKIQFSLFTLKISDSFDSNDYIFLEIRDSVISLSKQHTDESITFNLYTLVNQVNLDVLKDEKDVITTSLHNVLLKKSIDTKDITTFDFENISFFVDPTNIAWLIFWGLQFEISINKALTSWKQFQVDKQKSMRELLYDLSRGGIDYNISHDPPCITKPSYIAGFCQNHIRMDGNWMIIPRLRHVMQNLPTNWLEVKNQMYKDRIWEAPKNSEDEVAVIFGNWRCWDNHKTKDNFIFRTVFEIEEKAKRKLLHTCKFALKNLTVSVKPFKDVLLLKDLFVLFNEDYLEEIVKNVALPLLDQPIQRGLDVTVKIRSIITNFTNLVCIFKELSSTIENINSAMDKLNEVINQSSADEMDSTTSLNEVERYEPAEPLLITTNFTIEEYSHSFGINKSILTFYGQGTKMTSSIIKSAEIMSCTLNFKNTFFTIEFLVTNTPLFEIHCENHTTSLVNTGSFKTGKTLLFVANDFVNLSILPDTKDVLNIIDETVESDIVPVFELIKSLKKEDKLQDLTDSNSQLSKQTSAFEKISNNVENNIFQKVDFDFTVSLKISKILVHIELLSPFFANFEIQDHSVSLKLGNFGCLTEYNVSHSKWFVGSQNSKYIFEYFSTNIDKIRFMITDQYRENAHVVLFTFLAGIVRLDFTHNDLIDVIIEGQSDISTAQKNWDLLIQKIEKAQKRIDQITASSKVESKLDPTIPQKIELEELEKIDIFKKVHLFLNVGFNNITSVVAINGNKVHFDCLKPKFEIQTFDRKLDRYSPFGKFSFPSITFGITLSGIHGVSTIIDLQTIVEIINPELPSHKLQKLNITSSHFRAVVNPIILEEVIETYGAVAVHLKPRAKKDVVQGNPANLEDTIETILSFFSISIVANNVCFGWLFSENDEIYTSIAPGIIFGFEKTSILCAKDAGKIISTGMYLSTAHGFNSSTFYSTKSEKIFNNRVYFPVFTLIYKVDSDEKSNQIRAKVDGETVNFKFQTNIFRVTEHVWKTIDKLQDRYSHVQHYIRKKKSKEPEISDKLSDTHTVSKTKITSPKSPITPFSNKKVTILRCAFKFGGASFFIFNSNMEVDGLIPVLSLESPGISAAMRYVHDINTFKKHSLFLSILISETHNKLSCACVPVLQDIIDSTKTMMRNSSTRDKMKQNKSLITTTTERNTSAIDFVKFTDKIDINMTLKIEPQSLTLTCEPRANIEAEVIIDEINLIVKTDHQFVSAVLSLSGIKSELKHVYSKVRSGSISLNQFSITGTMAMIEGEKKFSTVATLDSVDLFINIQQRQDLDLFKNFWLPNNSNNLVIIKKNKRVVQKKTFASMLKEVSTTSAFAFILTLIIRRMTGKIDLGSSLGELSIDINDLVAISTKSSNWDNNIKVEFNKICLESKGRLSGTLVLNKPRITSAISWKFNNRALDIPLVLVSAGFQNLETRISLDYHPFFILQIIKFEIVIYNQRKLKKNDILKFGINMESFKVFMTALTASNFVDIYTIGLRIRQDIKLSYKQVLNEAQSESNLDDENIDDFEENMFETSGLSNIELITKTDKSKRKVALKDYLNNVPSDTFLKLIEKLETFIHINVKSTEIQIFPSSLLDPQALVIKIGEHNVKFYQHNLNVMKNDIKLSLADIKVSLSSFKETPTDKSILNPENIQQYIDMTSKSIADNIFVFPSLKVQMTTIQKLGENIIKYNFKCKFDGRVDIKWKIGSVYFIREMWYSHAITLSNRLTALRFYTFDEYDEELEENYKESTIESINLEDKIKNVESDKKYNYIAINEPEIDTPQLKDLGNATPPLEWFGLHRDKFPNLTHQFVIIGLQKMIDEVEYNYSKVLK